MLRCRTSVTWTTKRLRTTEMTTARASAWTISSTARHEKGASSPGPPPAPLDRAELPDRRAHLVRCEVASLDAAAADVEAVGVARGEAHDALLVAADPDRWSRPLRRLRRADRAVDAVMAAVIRRGVLAPEPRHDLERVLELRHALAGRREIVAV